MIEVTNHLRKKIIKSKTCKNVIHVTVIFKQYLFVFYQKKKRNNPFVCCLLICFSKGQVSYEARPLGYETIHKFLFYMQIIIIKFSMRTFFLKQISNI